MIDIINPMIKQFLPFAQERMGFKKPPKLFLRGSAKNAANPLGKTAFYDPTAKAVTLYITDRHPKDVMRSLSHELVHHTQNCRGDFNNVGEMGEGYAQNDEHLREMEREAYEKGNMCFRDWEDSIKSTIYFEHLQKGATKTMSTKEWKNGELTTLLSEAWGFTFDSTLLTETGAKDTGASKGDKGKDPDDPEARDYEHGGDRKGDESKTHKGEKDYTTKKGDELKHDEPGGRGEKKGDKAYVNEDATTLEEDSGEDEKHDYEHDDWNDKDHLDALLHHAHELRKDMDYDHDHESLEESPSHPEDRADRTAGRDSARRLKKDGQRVEETITHDQIKEVARRVIARMTEIKKNG